MEYQPDFVADAGDAIHRLEPRAANQLTDLVVLAKKEAAVRWCENASNHAATHAGKPWRYALIPHDAIAENLPLAALARRTGMASSSGIGAIGIEDGG